MRPAAEPATGVHAAKVSGMRGQPRECALRRVRAISENPHHVPLPRMVTLEVHEHSRCEQGRQRTARVEPLVLDREAERRGRLDDR